LTALQRSIHALLIGRTSVPDWLTHGVPQGALVATATVSVDLRPSRAVGEQVNGMSLASDGCYLYLHGMGHGLVKIGSGFGNTIMVS
jgi:hypothetical protein